jgi:hypothetical protein
LYVRAATAGGDRIVLADVVKWESGQPAFERVIEPEGLDAPQHAGWSTSETIVIAAQAGGRYGIFLLDAAASVPDQAGVFQRDVVAGVETVVRDERKWRWIVGGGVAIAAILLFRPSEEDDPGDDIGDPPCPPGIEDC